jgi:hypothetical protein
VVAGWQRGDLLGLPLAGLTGEEVLALERPADDLRAGQLGERLQRQFVRADCRWRHPASG